MLIAILSCFGLSAFFFYLNFRKSTKDFHIDANPMNATGKVIDFKKTIRTKGDEEKYENYAPIIQFNAAFGDEVIFTANYISKTVDYLINEPVKVVYDELNYNNARLRNESMISSQKNSSSLVMGILLLLIGLYFSTVWVITLVNQ